MGSMKSLFISHAVKDKELVDALIELFEGGIGFKKRRFSAAVRKAKAFRTVKISDLTCELNYRMQAL
jgi:hypothetical protein